VHEGARPPGAHGRAGPAPHSGCAMGRVSDGDSGRRLVATGARGEHAFCPRAAVQPQWGQSGRRPLPARPQRLRLGSTPTEISAGAVAFRRQGHTDAAGTGCVSSACACAAQGIRATMGVSTKAQRPRGRERLREVLPGQRGHARCARRFVQSRLHGPEQEVRQLAQHERAGPGLLISVSGP
jgi:hypothetical protein